MRDIWEGRLIVGVNDGVEFTHSFGYLDNSFGKGEI